MSDPGAETSIAGWECNCPPYSVTGRRYHCKQCQVCKNGLCFSSWNPLWKRCCIDGQKCCEGTCIPTDSICCDGGTVCSSDETCCHGSCARRARIDKKHARAGPADHLQRAHFRPHPNRCCQGEPSQRRHAAAGRLSPALLKAPNGKTPFQSASVCTSNVHPAWLLMTGWEAKLRSPLPVHVHGAGGLRQSRRSASHHDRNQSIGSRGGSLDRSSDECGPGTSCRTDRESDCGGPEGR